MNTLNVKDTRNIVYAEIMRKSREEIANIMRVGAPLDEDKEFFVYTSGGYEHITAYKSALLLGSIESPEFNYAYTDSKGHHILAHKLSDDIKDPMLGEIEKGDYIIIDFNDPMVRSSMDAFAFEDEYTQLDADTAIAVMHNEFSIPLPDSMMEHIGHQETPELKINNR